MSEVANIIDEQELIEHDMEISLDNGSQIESIVLYIEAYREMWEDEDGYSVEYS